MNRNWDEAIKFLTQTQRRFNCCGNGGGNEFNIKKSIKNDIVLINIQNERKPIMTKKKRKKKNTHNVWHTHKKISI